MRIQDSALTGISNGPPDFRDRRAITDVHRRLACSDYRVTAILRVIVPALVMSRAK